MRYIGSKTWSLDHLFALVKRELPESQSLCDPFAGTCTVAKSFKKSGFRVITGDLLTLSYAFQIAHVAMNNPPRFTTLRQHLGLRTNREAPSESVLAFLTNRPPRQGWVTNNYSPIGSARRKYFTAENARQIDSIRLAIREWTNKSWITKWERWYLIAAMLHAVDRVANTAGTYYASLRTFYRKAKRPVVLQSPEIISTSFRHKANIADAAETVREQMIDVLYLDPPYNQRDYGVYYHLPELLARDLTPVVTGKSGRPPSRPKRSPFCSSESAAIALRQILEVANTKLIVLHYAVRGLLDHDTLVELLRQRGPTKWETWTSRAYCSKRNQNRSSGFSTRVYVCTPS